MKKLFVSTIVLASLSIITLNSCSKSNNMSTSGGIHDSTSKPYSGQPFELAYVIKPLTADITSITFTDENGNPRTVYDLDLFPGGKLDLTVSKASFKASMSVVARNMSHPIGLHLEILVDGKIVQAGDFTIPTMESYTASVAYDVQLK